MNEKVSIVQLDTGVPGLRRLVNKLEVSETALQEKNEELENFHDIVVGRELKMMQLEKENEQLLNEVDRLKSEAHKP